VQAKAWVELFTDRGSKRRSQDSRGREAALRRHQEHVIRARQARQSGHTPSRVHWPWYRTGPPPPRVPPTPTMALAATAAHEPGARGMRDQTASLEIHPGRSQTVIHCSTSYPLRPANAA